MRSASPLVFALALLGPSSSACWDEPPRDELEAPAATPGEAEIELPAPLRDAAEAPAPVVEADDPATTIAAPITARTLTLEAERLDGLALDGAALIVAGARGGRLTLWRLEPDGATATKVQATLDAAPLPTEAPSLLSATRHAPAMAAWTDAEGAVWGLVVDARLAEQRATRLLDAADGAAVGRPALAPADDGAMICTGMAADVLRCATLTRGGALTPEGWAPLGKTRGVRAEALAETASGWLLIAGACKPAGACKRLDLVGLRLGADGLPPRKRPTIALPELERRHDGLVLVPEGEGLLLVGRRHGAAEASAWRIGERDADELDGKWSRVVGGLDSDDGLVLVEQAPLAMDNGFPVVKLRPRPLVDGKRGEPRAWPSAVGALVPRGVDQRVRSGEGFVVSFEPVRDRRARATVLRLGGAPGS